MGNASKMVLESRGGNPLNLLYTWAIICGTCPCTFELVHAVACTVLCAEVSTCAESESLWSGVTKRSDDRRC